jgi:hypothetical protein
MINLERDPGEITMATSHTDFVRMMLPREAPIGEPGDSRMTHFRDACRPVEWRPDASPRLPA